MIRPNRKIGDAALALLALAPLAVGLWHQRPESSFELLLLGRATAVLGLSCLLLAALISVRIPGVDLWFGGLTRLWKIHHFVGAAAFLLLMAHPLLLAFAAAKTSVQSAAAVLFPGPSAWGVWAGWLALAAMAIFLAPTFRFFGRPEYQRWKALHRLSVVAVAMGLAHALASGRLLPGGRGAAIWSCCGAAVLLVFAYRLFAARRIGRKAYTIVRAEAIGRGVVELTLKPDGDLLRYRDGQFVYLTPLAPGLASGRGEEHPYTLSSARHEPALRIVIKALGDASRALQTVPVGSKALVEGPYGEFFPAGGFPARELWIAGGIGLTPFLARARALGPGEPVDIHLVYCVQDESRAYFRAELEAVTARVAGFRLSMHYFAREGPLDAAFLGARCPDFTGRNIFVCGPPELIAVASGQLRRAGVPAARVRSEDFNWL